MVETDDGYAELQAGDIDIGGDVDEDTEKRATVGMDIDQEGEEGIAAQGHDRGGMPTLVPAARGDTAARGAAVDASTAVSGTGGGAGMDGGGGERRQGWEVRGRGGSVGEGYAQDSWHDLLRAHAHPPQPGRTEA